MTGTQATEPFLADAITLRERARRSIETGRPAQNCDGGVAQTVEILQSVLAMEIVCVLRYTLYAVSGSGLLGDGVQAEFAERAREEQGHMMEVAERIQQLGGRPNFDPEGLASRAASQYFTAADAADTARENLLAEEVVMGHYCELARYFTDRDPATRTMLEHLLGNAWRPACGLLAASEACSTPAID